MLICRIAFYKAGNGQDPAEKKFEITIDKPYV